MPPESLDLVLARHREELHLLQDRIAGKKKNATKKTRRGVNDECAGLESRLREKHAGEVAALGGAGGDGDDDDDGDNDNGNNGNRDGGDGHAGAPNSAPKSASQSASKPNDEAQNHVASPTTTQPPRKRNRQKERLARRAAEQDAAAVAAAAEASATVDRRGLESDRMRREMDAHSLVEEHIRPDGHCLFSAVADQLRQRGLAIAAGEGGGGGGEDEGGGEAKEGKEGEEERHGQDLKQRTEGKEKREGERDERSREGEEDSRGKHQHHHHHHHQTGEPDYKTLRRRTAAHIEAHPDAFAPFLDEPLSAYAAKIRDTAEWGGQVELTALASAYAVEIRVVQDGPVQTIVPDGEGGADRPVIWLAYYRHGYGLGEHYNSLRMAV